MGIRHLPSSLATIIPSFLGRCAARFHQLPTEIVPSHDLLARHAPVWKEHPLFGGGRARSYGYDRFRDLANSVVLATRFPHPSSFSDAHSDGRFSISFFLPLPLIPPLYPQGVRGQEYRTSARSSFVDASSQ